MEIKQTIPLIAGKYLSLFERSYTHNGTEGKYYFASREKFPSAPEVKKPDAVVIVGFIKGDDGEIRIVLTKEFRLPVGGVEIGFPAGLIDAKDYDGLASSAKESMQAAATNAAIREFKEETGLSFQPIEVSPPNLYSSAGMTNESICVVLGIAAGSASKEYLEEHEDIDTMFLTHAEMVDLLNKSDSMSKIAWPFLWSFKYNGFPKHLT